MTTILVVDDSVLVNQLLFETLTSHGYHVLQAHDAARAYNIIQREIPDLIILDIVLPDVSGVQLCQAFRNHPPTRHVPIILVTGTASSTAEKVKGLQAGADDYIIKPFEMDELVERIRAVLRRTQARPAPEPAAVASRAPGSGPGPAPVPGPGRLEDTRTQTPPNVPPKSIPSVSDALWRTLFSPASLPPELPSISPLYLVALLALILAGLALAPASGVKPVLACMEGGLIWGFLVSVLVVMSSLLGVGIKWKEGASVLSLAAVPLLLKLAGGVAFSAWTALSPFLYTASPLLFLPNLPPWIARADPFEIWAAVLLAILLRKRPGSSPPKAALVTLCVWIVAAVAAAGLARVGGTP